MKIMNRPNAGIFGAKRATVLINVRFYLQRETCQEPEICRHQLPLFFLRQNKGGRRIGLLCLICTYCEKDAL